MTPVALDTAIGIVIFLSMLIAYFRGFVKEVFTLAGLGLAVFSSYMAGHMLIPGLNKWLKVPAPDSKEEAELVFGFLSPEMMAKVIAYGGVFLVVFLITTLVGYIITRWLRDIGLGVIDRLLGAGFGFLRGFLLVFLIYVPFTYLIDQEKMPSWAKNSVSVPLLQQTLVWANKNFELDKMIEDRGNGIAIKFDKIDPDKIEESINDAEEDLKDAIQREESEIQKEEAPQ